MIQRKTLSTKSLGNIIDQTPKKFSGFSMHSIQEQFEQESCSNQSPATRKHLFAKLSRSSAQSQVIENSDCDDCSPTSNNTGELLEQKAFDKSNSANKRLSDQPSKDLEKGQQHFIFNSEQLNDDRSHSSRPESESNESDLYDEKEATYFHQRFNQLKSARNSDAFKQNLKERRHQSLMVEKLSVRTIIQSYDSINDQATGRGSKRRGSVKSFVNRKTSNDLTKYQDIGSPTPDNQILLPFQRQRRQLVTSRQSQMVQPAKFNHNQMRKLSDSSIPIELMQMQSNPLKSSVYRNMTLHIFHTINIIKHFKEIPAVLDEQIIPFTFKKSGMKKLIIFDLDETLIHCHVEQTYDENEDQESVKESEQDQFRVKSEHKIIITNPLTNENVKTEFSIRPYAIECLKQANLKYEVAIFTAAKEWYADQILDYIDPKGELIQHRYYQQHATYFEEQGFYVKDLRIFKGLDLKDVIIIDNYVFSFAFHLENGIPVVPYFGEKDDLEMIKVMKYINQISEQDDLRIPNNKVFQLKKILDSKIENFIKHYDIEKISNFDKSDSLSGGDLELEPKKQTSNSPKDDYIEIEILTVSNKSSNSSLDSKVDLDQFLCNYQSRRDLAQPDSSTLSVPKASRDNTPIRMDDPPESLVKRPPQRQRNSFIKFDGSLSKSLKSKGLSRENSYNDSDKKSESPLRLLKSNKSSMEVTDNPLLFIPQLKGKSEKEQDLPLSTIQPQDWNKRRRQSQMQSRRAMDTQSRQCSVVSKDIEEDLSKWQEAYQKICEKGIIYNFFQSNKSKFGPNYLAKHMSYPVGTLSRYNQQRLNSLDISRQPCIINRRI